MNNSKRSLTKIKKDATVNVKIIKMLLSSYFKKHGVKPFVEGHRVIFNKPFAFKWIDLEPIEKTMLNHLL